MRKIPFSIFKRLNSLWRPQYSVVRRSGVKFLLNKKNWIDQRILSFRSYERKNLQAMEEFSRKLNFDGFFDIGANFGYFSILIGKKTNIPQCIAFEPLKKNYDQLCANIFINEVEEKVKVHNLALSDRKEAATIWYNNSSTGISTLLNLENTVRTPDDYQISETIHCETFDHLYKEKNKRYLCKIDVEGFEEKTIQGMNRFLQENAIVLFIEIHDRESPVFKTLANLGYHQVFIKSDDFIFSNMEAFSRRNI